MDSTLYMPENETGIEILSITCIQCKGYICPNVGYCTNKMCEKNIGDGYSICPKCNIHHFSNENMCDKCTITCSNQGIFMCSKCFKYVKSENIKGKNMCYECYDFCDCCGNMESIRYNERKDEICDDCYDAYYLENNVPIDEYAARFELRYVTETYLVKGLLGFYVEELRSMWRWVVIYMCYKCNNRETEDLSMHCFECDPSDLYYHRYELRGPKVYDSYETSDISKWILRKIRRVSPKGRNTMLLYKDYLKLKDEEKVHICHSIYCPENKNRYRFIPEAPNKSNKDNKY